MARKLRVGFVGLGRVFDLNLHGYLGHPEAEVSALCDADPVVLARRAAEHPGARATRDFEDLLRFDLDLIEVLTPHPMHEAMRVAALAAGAHVSVQKGNGDGGRRSLRKAAWARRAVVCCQSGPLER